MDNKQVSLLADGLRLAEKAHAEYEKRGGDVGETTMYEWPEYYARWLIDNVHIWSPLNCADGSCEVHSHD